MSVLSRIMRYFVTLYALETIQINKLWYIQEIEYYSILKRNEILSHKKT